MAQEYRTTTSVPKIVRSTRFVQNTWCLFERGLASPFTFDAILDLLSKVRIMENGRKPWDNEAPED